MWMPLNGTVGVQRHALPLACLLLAAGCIVYGITAAPTGAQAGPLHIDWLPFISAAALVLLAPLTVVLATPTEIPSEAAVSMPAESAEEPLVRSLTARCTELEELLVQATGRAHAAAAEATTRCRSQALIVVGVIADAAVTDHPDSESAVRDFSARLTAALGYLDPTDS